MKFMIKIAMILAMSAASFAHATFVIDPKNSAFYAGDDVIACDMIKEVSPFTKGIYLNVGDRFPKQLLTLVIWEEDVHKFREINGEFRSLIGQHVCAYGVIKMYKGRPQMHLKNPYSIETQNRY